MRLSITSLLLLSLFSVFSQKQMELPSIENKNQLVTDLGTNNVLFLSSEEQEDILFKVCSMDGYTISEETFTLFPGRNVLMLNYLEAGEYLIEINEKLYRYTQAVESL